MNSARAAPQVCGARTHFRSVIIVPTAAKKTPAAMTAALSSTSALALPFGDLPSAALARDRLMNIAAGKMYTRVEPSTAPPTAEMRPR